jgi:hypothetical protein
MARDHLYVAPGSAASFGLIRDGHVDVLDQLSPSWLCRSMSPKSDLKLTAAQDSRSTPYG